MSVNAGKATSDSLAQEQSAEYRKNSLCPPKYPLFKRNRSETEVHL